jgi:hypothetical protein
MRSGGFSPASLFAGGIAGAWYGPSDLSTLFQVSDGTTPVTTAGQPVGMMLDKSGRANHATQATAAARPTYQTAPDRATLDKVDDRLSVTVPAGGFTGTMVLATDQGTASYGVTIPAGAYDIGGQYFPGSAISGQVIRDGALSAGEAAATEAYFVGNGATASYGAVTDFESYWRDFSELTSFPLINTSAGTNFSFAWRNCSGLTSFPLIDTSAGTSFFQAWRGCDSLTSFPLIDTSAGTNFYAAWYNCDSLTSFPLIDTSAGTDFRYVWYNCDSLTSFPLIDTSAGTEFRYAWYNCDSLTSFPLIDTSAGIKFERAWRNCSSLTSFPANAFDNIKGGDFTEAFTSTALTQTSIDNILVSLVTSGIATGTRVFDQSGGSAPSATGEAAIDTLRSRGWTVTVTGGYSSSSPSALFAGGTEGAWYDPSDLSTLFQDSAGTTPVTTAGQPVGMMLDKSGRANHATQATAAARPTYQTSPDRATLDKVDDRLSVTVPTGGFEGTMVLGTDQGTASYGVTIPAGAYDIGGRGGQNFPGNAIVGQLIRDGALSAGDAAATEAYFVANGATASYGAVTNFNSFWRDWSELTSFPLIDTSSGTDFGGAWIACSSLTSFPLIDTSSGTNFSFAWFNNTSLTSFPLIDTSSGTNFARAWRGCTSLTSFPLIDTSSGTDFFRAWFRCSSLTSFPPIDTSSGTNFSQAWFDCSSLTSFPANAFDNVSSGAFNEAFTSTALTQTSIDNILVSLVASGIAAGTRVFKQSGGSAPSAAGEAAIDTLRSRGWTVTVTGGY